MLLKKNTNIVLRSTGDANSVRKLAVCAVRGRRGALLTENQMATATTTPKAPNA